MIYKAYERDLGGCFTVEDIVEASGDFKQFFAPPLAGTASFYPWEDSVARGELLQQAHQLFIFLRDEVRESRAQFFNNRADRHWRSEWVNFALSASCSPQSGDNSSALGIVLHKDLYHI
jgi:hypothetical protein